MILKDIALPAELACAANFLSITVFALTAIRLSLGKASHLGQVPRP
jgi:hypothetical protein